MKHSARSATRILPSPMTALYDDPWIYDALHTPGTAAEVRGLIKIERNFASPPDRVISLPSSRAVLSPAMPAARKRATAPVSRHHASVWLEPACGTGRYLIEAARKNPRSGRRGLDPGLRHCIGFDLSQGMIDFARAQARQARVDTRVRFFQGDMTTFAPEIDRSTVTLAFNPINTIRHLGSDAAMLAHFEQIARVLAPGGVYAVGLSLSAPEVEGPTEDVWTGRRGPVHIHQVVEYEPPAPPPSKDRKEWVRSHLTITRRATKAGHKPPAAEHRDDAYALRTYTRPQWERLIKRSALSLAAPVDESGKPHDPGLLGYAIWVLKKR